jgi:hypothetical protein
MKAPRAEPMPPIADLIDINVPRCSGTCSRVRLIKAEKAKPINSPPRNLADAETHRIGRFVYAAINNPPNKPVMTITGLRPYLFTNLEQLMLPAMKNRAPPITKIEAKLLETENCCL